MKNFFCFCEDRKETDGAPFIIRSVGEKLQKDKDGNAPPLKRSGGSPPCPSGFPSSNGSFSSSL